MNIAIDISPLSSGHKVRGVGSYVSLIRENIESYDKKNKYQFFEGQVIPGEADLIHYPYFDPFIISLPKKFKKTTIVTVHDLTPIVFKKYFPVGIKGNIRWLLQKSRLKKADLIIADSKSSKKDIVSLTGISENKVKVVYLGVDEEFKQLDAKQFDLEIIKKYKLPEKFLLYVGDATWNKNLPNLISAVKKTNYQLVLVGKVWEKSGRNIDNNPWNRDLEKVLNEIEDDEQFLRLGFVPDSDLVKLYNLATCLLMPSIYEGFGLPILEAMSCGCPVICSRKGSLPEVAGEAAYYVDIDEKSIENGLKDFLTKPNLIKELSYVGLDQSKKFSIDKMIGELINIYEDLG